MRSIENDIDLRSDTVNALEGRAATLLGKEAGLFVPSGTMGIDRALTVFAAATRGVAG